jgi:hypothetical protein
MPNAGLIAGSGGVAASEVLSCLMLYRSFFVRLADGEGFTRGAQRIRG